MNIVKVFNNLCTPVKVYFICSMISIAFTVIIFNFPHLMLQTIYKEEKTRNIKNNSKFNKIIMDVAKSAAVFGFFMSFIITYVLQLLCKKFNKKFIWVIVAVMLLPSLLGNLHILFNLF